MPVVFALSPRGICLATDVLPATAPSLISRHEVHLLWKAGDDTAPIAPHYAVDPIVQIPQNDAAGSEPSRHLSRVEIAIDALGYLDMAQARPAGKARPPSPLKIVTLVRIRFLPVVNAVSV